MKRKTNLVRPFGQFFARLFVVLACCCLTPIYGQQTNTSGKALNPIVVTAQRLKDAEMIALVETALHSDPYVLDDHVTVTAKNGVVTLRGIVLDEWDARQMKRIVRKMPGVRMVVDDLELIQGGD